MFNHCLKWFKHSFHGENDDNDDLMIKTLDCPRGPPFSDKTSG